MNGDNSAYPHDRFKHEGLTKREMIAAMAMQGICSHPDTWGADIDGIAKHAVTVADAIISELSKGQKK